MAGQETFVPTPSGIALGEVLDEGGPIAKAIEAAVHRTMLWRFRTGRRQPDAETIAKLHNLSNGRVAANGWTRATVLPTGGEAA
jgi:hypothetical protein